MPVSLAGVRNRCEMAPWLHGGLQWLPREEEINADNRVFLKAPKISHFDHVGVTQYQWQQSLTCPKVEVEISSMEEPRSHSRASLFSPKSCGIEAKRENIRNEAPQISVCLLTVEHFCFRALGAFLCSSGSGKEDFRENTTVFKAWDKITRIDQGFCESVAGMS